MAEEAASKMKEKAYSKKIENATEKVDAAVENLVRKYIIDKNGWTTTASSIKGRLTFKIPSSANYIKVDGKEYDALLKLDSKRRLLENERDEFGEQVYDALVALRTEKNVEKELPEALEYLVFPEVKAVPMPVFSGLREIISSIKEEQS